jgi:flagellar hook-basal body complex protein FliE
MKLFSTFDVVGDVVNLRKTHKNHFGAGRIDIEPKEDVAESFGTMLNNAMKKVNDLQLNADALTQKSIVTPHKVNVHEVMIAVQKAQFSLNFTKAIRDRIIRAYQTIVSMR